MAGVGEPALLLPAGATPHSYSLRPSDARKLARADLVIRVGPALESFLAKPLANIAHRARVVTLMRDVHLSLIPHSGHDDQESDPHIWLDPENARRIVRHVTAVLARADPDNGSRYTANSKKLLARIDRLDGFISTTLKPVRRMPYIVFHDGYQYFERRYGLNHVAAITLSPERTPGARRLQQIRGIIRANGARCVFTEPQFSPTLAHALTRGANTRIATLDPLGDGIRPGPDAWFKMMRGLAASLRACLAGG
ncbi:MAG: zinc ABC transporter substrate-binding protein [Rhodospirillales bacterium]|nr:zinc ABC transporter substrate-binding protein [Rhodospirillales bacterium]